MVEILKKIYRKIKKEMAFFFSVNWIKTIYFNFKMLPFNQANKLPFYFYGKVCFSNLSGKVIIEAPIKKAMIGFGQKFEITTIPKGVAKVCIFGKLVFKGYAHIGNDYLLYVDENSYCEFGDMSCLGSNVKVICREKIIIGDWTAIGYESQIVDTNSHYMLNTYTGEHYKKTEPILLGKYNSISNRVSIKNKTTTPDNCVVASNSLLNKDYTGLGEKILIGGIPAKLLRNNFARDWEGEKENIKRHRGVR